MSPLPPTLQAILLSIPMCVTMCICVYCHILLRFACEPFFLVSISLCVLRVLILNCIYLCIHVFRVCIYVDRSMNFYGRYTNVKLYLGIMR